MNQCGRKAFRKKEMWVEREMWERKNKRRGIKRKEQKYEVRISSTPYAINR